MAFQFISFGIWGQEKDSSVSHASHPNIFSIAAGVHRGFIFAHSPAVENTSGAHPTGIEVSLGWQKSDSATWEICNCYPNKGLLVAYYDYDTRILGKGVLLAYFLEPNYRLSKKILFFIRGNVGLAYLTNPFDSVKNPTNQSYSGAINGYLFFGIGLWFQPSKHWSLNGSLNYQHVSNGGLSLPNKGINWPTAGISIKYQKDSRAYYTGIRIKDKSWKKNPVRWNIALFGIAKKGTDARGRKKRLPLVGLNFQGGKQVGRINMLTLGTEVFYDESLRMQLKRDSINASAAKVGLSFGHAFILGKFLFSQRLGVYLLDQTPYYDQLYHRWGIDYSINKHWGLGMNLLAHRQVADFIDIRFSYSL
ncbi:MAG TPA: acyloxyacyl hydrolase [Chitinophagaceae bacterium]|nr:acyloxyacyl hydrolase [Chitinophagaceae bacterium]